MQKRVKCMSTYRAWSLYSVQKEVIQKVAVSSAQHMQRLFFLDVHPAYYLSAYHA
jgi:hypothetical protein